MNEFQLAFLKQLAKGLAAQFGENCEIVVHDLNKDHLDQSIVAIDTGHVTKRQLGDGPSHAVLQGLTNPQELSDHLNYLTRTQDGRILKSSTIYIRDEKGQVVGLFAINYDSTHLLMAESALRPLTSAQSEDRDPEPIVQNVNDLLDELIAQSVQLVGKPVALIATCGYPVKKGADLWEAGMQRYCKHSRLRLLGMLAQWHRGYDTVFMDPEKARLAAEFARKVNESI